MCRKKPIIGLCGGAGAGKSQVAAEFARLGCLVISSDRLNHEVLRRPEILATLRGWWGDDVVAADGGPNRARLAEIVFADAEQRRRLESLVHPLIAQLREGIILAGQEDPAIKAIILDSPLLFESNLARLCDTIVFVEASETRRLQRVQQARHWNLIQLREREKSQQPLADKRAKSEFVVNNEGSIDRLRPQVIAILEKVVSRHSCQR